MTGDGGAGGLGGPIGAIYLTGFDNMPNLERVAGIPFIKIFNMKLK